MSDYVVVDIETTGKDPFKDELLCVGIGERVYPPEEGRRLARRLMVRPGTVLVAHTNFDLRWLMLEGARLGKAVHYHDSKVLAWLLDGTQPLDLESLTERYCGYVPDKRLKQVANRVMFRRDSGELVPIEEAPWDELAAYNRSDLKAEADLYEALRTELKRSGQWSHFLVEEAPFSRLLVEMEATGMPFDRDAALEMQAENDAAIARLDSSLVAFTSAPNFNLGSNDQVARFLYTDVWKQPVRFPIPRLAGLSKEEKLERVEAIAPPRVRVTKIGRDYAYGELVLDGMGLRPPKRSKKQKTPRPSVSGKTLSILYGENPWVIEYSEWRRLTKLRGYLRDWIERCHDGRLHGRFDQSGTVTGRLAAREPNLQQVATEGPVRDLFRGELVVGDYCVAPEMRVLTQELRWVAAEELREGDSLIGFDEERKDGQRRLRPTTITRLERKRLPAVVVATDRGEWQVSCGHRFLVRSPKRLEWKRADALQPGDAIAWVGEPWEEDTSREGGYLAGFLDGEGWVSPRAVGYAQKEGVVLDLVQRLLRERGIDPGIKNGSNSSAIQYQLRGGLFADLRALGMLRPLRLLERAERRWSGVRIRNGVASPAAVVGAVQALGEREVIAFGTTTQTFIMEGALSHNSGLEVRISAHFSLDPVMLGIFESGGDLYGTLAAKAWGGPPDKSNEARGLMKVLMLASQYGCGPEQVSELLALAGLRGYDIERSRSLLKDFQNTLPRLFAWRKEVIAQAQRDGFVTTLAGRRRTLAGINSAAWERKAKAERQAVSSKVQGSAADIVRRSMLRARDAVDPAVARICLQVHDEIIWERGPAWSDDVFPELVDVCQHAHGFELDVPLIFEAKIAESWGEKEGSSGQVHAGAYEHLNSGGHQ